MTTPVDDTDHICWRPGIHTGTSLQVVRTFGSEDYERHSARRDQHHLALAPPVGAGSAVQSSTLAEGDVLDAGQGGGMVCNGDLLVAGLRWAPWAFFVEQTRAVGFQRTMKGVPGVTVRRWRWFWSKRHLTVADLS